ncbi:P-loop containing nucleoside triphosphate hydrolase protein [Aspergillus cavernicola]|uniref:P-loop containing nucleoside triphosphate hydrolase protein n=1 Tax=Aspergillus cavernicola TaxID=176166 RepID=A0ABR4J5H6_9EURO
MADKNPKVNGEEEDKGAKKRIARYDEYYDYRSNDWKLKKTAKKEKQKNVKGAVLVVRRLIDFKGRYSRTEIDIKSSVLVEVLRELNPGVESLVEEEPPTASARGRWFCTLANSKKASPVLFYHSRFGLKSSLETEETKEQPNEVLVDGLSVALTYIEEDHAHTIASMDSLLSRDEISWEYIWALFIPQTLVYHYHRLTQQDQILRFCEAEKRLRKTGVWYWQIRCDVIVSNGVKLGFTKVDHFSIDEFPGARKIYDLPIFPLDFVRNKSAVYKHAVERGKRYCEISGESYLECDGPAMREILNKELEPKQFTFSSFGRAMVDAKAFKTFEPNATYNYDVYKQLQTGTPENDDDFAICSPIVVGFSFGAKLWGGLGMDYCRPIKWGHDTFELLVLDPIKKKLVHALVTQHTNRGDHFDDIVAGKGKGLIGLLSGGPGCGKTLTAEAVSEETRRPLYSVSAGELGTNPADVDKRLTLILELSQRWNAILLFDEADVFLQARNDTDVVRNALVSIFLRQLEYYKGIMILTTNRIGIFDPAFESRIHFSFFYPDLDFLSRRKIWKTFLTRRLHETSAAPICVDDSQLDQLARTALNGRQIKNLVSCAQSLAFDEGDVLEMRHFQSALAVASDWSMAVQKVAVPVSGTQ